MAMSPFFNQCPDVAQRETFGLRVQQAGLPLPPGEYAFLELYCIDPACDCRRVVFQVHSPQFPGCILATINYGWESAEFYNCKMPWDENAGCDITSASLDPLNPNSGLADALLTGFRDFLKINPEANRQLKRHYEMFKAPQKKRRGKRT